MAEGRGKGEMPEAAYGWHVRGELGCPFGVLFAAQYT